VSGATTPQPQGRELLQEGGFLHGERVLLRGDVGKPALDGMEECRDLGRGRHGESPSAWVGAGRS